MKRSLNLERKKIYDPLLRILHASIGGSVLGLVLSAWASKFYFEEGILRKSFILSHIYLGYLLLFAFALRIFWGLIGPKTARFSELVKLKEWLQAIRSILNRNFKLKTRWGWGHHPYAAFAYLSFYIALVGLGLSGLVLAAIEHNQGPLAVMLFDNLGMKSPFDDIHELLSWFSYLFILTHLGALYWHERNDQVPIVQSMFSGYQYKEIPDEKLEV